MRRFLAVGLWFAFFYSNAQSITSPYSNYGIGELNEISLPHQFGMAGTGASVPNLYFINLENPALLTYNVLTSFQVGIQGDLRNYNTSNQSASDATASVNNMILSLPILVNKWTTAVSLLPYSSVNYDLTSTQLIANSSDSVINRFRGSGGLSQVSWSHGVRLGKNLNVGLRASYVFGSVVKNISNSLLTDQISSTFIVDYEESTSYSDIILTASAAYKLKFSETNWLNFGLIYDFGGTLNGASDETLTRLTNTEAVISQIDVSEDVPTTFDLPSGITFGVSYEKINQLIVGTDIKYQSWSQNQAENVELKNALHASFGVQYTPDYKDVNSYFKRMDYRFGASFVQLPYEINQTEVNEIGVNFGISFPTKNFSSIDAGFRVGTRGSTSNGLLRESFVQGVFGLTINDRWFIKRRYD
jgi:hypothetical protein